MEWKDKTELNKIFQLNLREDENQEQLISFLKENVSNFDTQDWEIFIDNFPLTNLELILKVKPYMPSDIPTDIGWRETCRFSAYFKAINNSMNFGEAIETLKEGKKVTRRGWNGKDMFLWLKPEAEIKAEWCKDPELKKIVEANGGTIKALGTICMYCYAPDGSRCILTGWLASQTDMLAEDWMIYRS